MGPSSTSRAIRMCLRPKVDNRNNTTRSLESLGCASGSNLASGIIPQLYTALPSRCTSYSYIKPLTLVYYILCSGDLHFIQLKLYIAMISIDLISLISKIHICLKVYIFRYTTDNRCIFFLCRQLNPDWSVTI